ncbi:MAG TPA: hypothetical protein VHL80_09605 [Polyangia bacterium]|nr:hypothetical protein [Polyangia bacterium]
MFLDIVYGLVAVHMLTYLPSVKDMGWAGRPLGLLGELARNTRELWRATMGFGITAIAWLVCARRLSRLRATDALHSGLVLIQTGLTSFFIYFAICDPTLTGGPTPRALQCGSLALASAAGQLWWSYARRRGLVDPETPREQLDDVSARGWQETLSALLITPLSWIGPLTWTAGWAVVPLALLLGSPRLRRAGLRPQRAARPSEP